MNEIKWNGLSSLANDDDDGDDDDNGGDGDDDDGDDRRAKLSVFLLSVLSQNSKKDACLDYHPWPWSGVANGK